MQSGDNLDGLLSPFLRQQRIKAAQPYILGRVLDFGCGAGLLARLPGIDSYVGVDIDGRILDIAAAECPAGRFLRPEELGHISEERFDTVAALAVIEHLADPLEFLRDMRGLLAAHGRIVVTTPNPVLDWVHGLGARMGIFAAESHEEHQSLMGKRDLFEAASASDLEVATYRRFLFGANQLAVLQSK